MLIQRLMRRFTLMDAATDGTDGGAGGGTTAAAAPEPSILEAMGKGGDPAPVAAAAAAAASAASAASAPQTADQQALQASETDTRRPAVMEAALVAGAQIINDVSALRHDPRSLEQQPLARRRGRWSGGGGHWDDRSGGGHPLRQLGLPGA